MARATVVANLDHNMAIFWWTGIPNDRMMIDAVNKALELAMRDTDSIAFVYKVWEGNEHIGCLVAGNYSPENDAEIKAIYNKIKQEHLDAPQSGEWAAVGVDV